jgi:hypothetical protein
MLTAVPFPVKILSVYSANPGDRTWFLILYPLKQLLAAQKAEAMRQIIQNEKRLVWAERCGSCAVCRR